MQKIYIGPIFPCQEFFGRNFLKQFLFLATFCVFLKQLFPQFTSVVCKGIAKAYRIEVSVFCHPPAWVMNEKFHYFIICLIFMPNYAKVFDQVVLYWHFARIRILSEWGHAVNGSAPPIGLKRISISQWHHLTQSLYIASVYRSHRPTRGPTAGRARIEMESLHLWLQSQK